MTKAPLLKLLDAFLTENPRSWEWETIGDRSRNLKMFLRWMDEKHLKLEDLDFSKIRQFTLELVDKDIDHERRYHTRLSLYYFLEWLHRKDYPIADPKELVPYKKPRSLFIDASPPPYALEYLRLTQTKVKPTTFSSYRTAIKHFHRFLSDRSIEIQRVDRKVMETYFVYLMQRGQGPASRIGNIVQIRVYLRWLRDRGLVEYDPEKLIQWADLPKRPNYLPRPLSPKVDRLVQKRLSASKDLHHQGLLLMRWTGIRVGELANLTFHCLKTDHGGHKFLRVPLGKLNNERLVPLDQKAVDLIRSIQQKTTTLVGKTPPHLLVEKTGRQARTYLLMAALREMVEDIDTDEPIVTHRLRHTYATELLCAGINILALKDILGHHDIKMTLRYASVTQEKVRQEYFAAMDRMKDQFVDARSASDNVSTDIDYSEIFKDLGLEMKKHGPVKGLSPTKISSLSKRIERLRKEVEKVLY